MLRIDYFNPIVEDWTEQCIEMEEFQKCNFHLYIFTPAQTGFYSFIELMDSVYTKNIEDEIPLTTFFNYSLYEGNTRFEEGKIKSLNAIGRKIESLGGVWIKGTLGRVAETLNNYGK